MSNFGRALIAIGLLIIVLTILAFVFSFIYDSIYHPHDMNLPGLLAVAALFYGCPLAVVLIVVGLFFKFISRD
jgi:hypothetical protein